MEFQYLRSREKPCTGQQQWRQPNRTADSGTDIETNYFRVADCPEIKACAHNTRLGENIEEEKAAASADPVAKHDEAR